MFLLESLCSQLDHLKKKKLANVENPNIQMLESTSLVRLSIPISQKGRSFVSCGLGVESDA
jgi:hypothetical protein